MKLFGSLLPRLLLLLSIGVSPLAVAHSFTVGDLQIDHPYAVSTHPFSRTGVMYVRLIKNNGPQADKLLSARTTASASVEMHTMKMDGNVMRMREVSGIELPAKSEVAFGPSSENGYHLMLIGLKNQLKDGDKFPVFLKFEKAGETEVMVIVQKTKDSAPEHKH